MSELTESGRLFKRAQNSMLVWTPPYGAGDPDRIFVMKRHYGPFIEGNYNGNPVKAVDLVQGILCRILAPDKPRLLEVEAEFADGKTARHISQASLNEEVVAAAEAFQKSLAHIGDYVILWATNGSTANDMATRIAVAYTRGGVPFHFKGAYHGANIGQNAVCGAPGWNVESMRMYLRNSERLAAIGAQTHVDHIFPAVAEQIGKYRDAGVKPILFAEDIQGVGGGFLKIDDVVLTAVAEMIEDAGGVFVNDIVQTLYRRGTVWPVEDWRLDKTNPKQAPKIMTGAKAVANGEGVGFVAVRRDIAEDLYANRDQYGLHWDTFAHHARNLKLAKTVLEIYQGDNLGENLLVESAHIRAGLEKIAAEVPEVIVGLQGHAGMIGVVMPDKDHTTRAIERAPEYGLYFGRGGERSQVLRIAPHADFTREASDLTIDGMKKLAYALADQLH